MKLTAGEKKHIDWLDTEWTVALAVASMSVRSNSKLIGCDRIREPLAIKAALLGAAYTDADKSFVAPAEAGEPIVGTQEILDAAFAAAVEPVREKMKKKPTRKRPRKVIAQEAAL